ncbi:MAG: hypothetical protein WBM61_17775 [Woeseiaceae bacterium]
MKKSLLVVFFVLQAACAGVAPDHLVDAQAGPVASAEDFRVVAGSGWNGHLSYLDYSSEALSQIPVEIRIDEPDGRTLSYSIRYPGETQYNSSEKIKLSRDGRKLNGGLIVTRKQNDNGDLTLVTTYQGQDDNRRADIRVTYAIGSTAFSISKEVRFEGESDYFMRSQYSLVR